MDVGIEVGDAILGDLILEGCHPLAAGVIGACACPIICTVTVHVHVRISTTARAGMQEDGSSEITAVGHLGSRVAITETPSENIGTFPRLDKLALGFI